MAADSGTEDRINKICRQMEEFAFCSQTFHSSLKGGSADYIGLTGIANNQAYTKATSTFGYVEELLRSVSDPTLKNALIVCENAYKVVKDSFGEGIQSFAQRDYRGMLNAERIAPRAQASCTSIFSTTPPPKQNPLSQINREMRILIAMAIDILLLLPCTQLQAYHLQSFLLLRRSRIPLFATFFPRRVCLCKSFDRHLLFTTGSLAAILSSRTSLSVFSVTPVDSPTISVPHSSLFAPQTRLELPKLTRADPSHVLFPAKPHLFLPCSPLSESLGVLPLLPRCVSTRILRISGKLDLDSVSPFTVGSLDLSIG
ncbi:putative invertase inhibitor [Cucumis melo var. makuwa]|uniref:Invertase inhibitor n=1 Tax=Cucumis melo var. makuwa TaxID=1194695 RepID=A0A5A7TYP7_CUCMM|nr:putative invertase inhibitor [Cucumis melo var. makuwa]